LGGLQFQAILGKKKKKNHETLPPSPQWKKLGEQGDDMHLSSELQEKV
jgi:hypothetical protein